MIQAVNIVSDYDLKGASIGISVHNHSDDISITVVLLFEGFRFESDFDYKLKSNTDIASSIRSWLDERISFVHEHKKTSSS